jgi:uncharacterized membrane protein
VSLARIQLRTRGIVAVTLIALGIFLIATAIGSMLTHFATFGSAPLLAAGGAVVFIIGLLLLITELMENWLSKGQAALVDGLQAG